MLRAVANRDVGMDDRARADPGAVADHGERPDRRVGRNDRRRGHARKTMNARQAGRFSIGEQLDRFRKRQVRMLNASIAHGAASAFSDRITADAAVVLSSRAYLGLVKNVRSPATASSMAATRVISISPSPSRRHSRRSAISLSFKMREVYPVASATARSPSARRT